MSALVEGARRLVGRTGDLETRVAGLAQAVEASRGRLDDALVDPAASLVERAQARMRLSSTHTVVALAGATGSGKSSTFNTLTGLELAAVGVRRPTTSWATACIWGTDGADELLDWLGIPQRHRVVRDSMLDSSRAGADDLHGLVLLDLPDHDSTETSHHLEMERLIEMADLMVWVLDPQKYADAAVHDRYLAPMAAHRDVILVVLNHIDEVPSDRRAGMLADVRRLLDADGLTGVGLVGTSALTGDGMPELRSEIVRRVADKAATRRRMTTDLAASADRLGAVTGSASPPQLSDRDKSELVESVADAAGVPLVVAAVRKATTVRARRATGWPVTSWLSRLRPDPLKRLHLDLSAGDRDLVRAARSSIPEPSHIQRARVESAVRDVADQVSRDLSAPWAGAVRRASTSRLDDLGDRLDRAVTSTDLGVARTPWWWRGVRLLQWLLFAAAIAGAGWLAVLAVMGYLKLPEASTPGWHGVPVPTLMLGAGVVLGVVLAVLCRALIAIGARTRARKAERRLRGAVREVTDELVIGPVEEELGHYRSAVEGLRRARG